MPSNACDKEDDMEMERYGIVYDDPEGLECSRDEPPSSQDALDDEDDDDRDDGDEASDESSSCRSSQTPSQFSDKRKIPPETPQRLRPVSLRKVCIHPIEA